MANTAGLVAWRFDTVSLIKIVLCFYIAFAPVVASAGAAEAISFLELKNVARTVSGVTADFRFQAANAELFEKKAVQVTNSELGQVWRKRWAGLSRGVGAAGLAVAAVAGLLEAVDWILDPANNSIYKVNPSDVYLYCYDTEPSHANCYSSPQLVFNKFKEESGTYNGSHYYFDRHIMPSQSTLDNLQPNQMTNFTIIYKDDRDDSPRPERSLSVYVLKNVSNSRVEATDSDIADAVSRADDATAIELAQSPDYQLEQHVPTLAAADGAEPATPTPPKTCTAPAVLTNGQCVVPDKQVKPTPDGGFEIPAFCGWATTVCEFMDWYKTDPVEKTPDQTKVDIKDRDINDIPNIPDIDSNRISWSQQCPSPVTANFSLMGQSVDWQYKFDTVCDFAAKFRPYVIGLSYLTAAYIVMGLNRTRSE